MKFLKRNKRVLLYGLLVALVLCIIWIPVRQKSLAVNITPDSTMLKHIENVTILRDNYGVPHIFGKTDADTAFGLAYAHAEDDFPLIYKILAAGRGRLALIDRSTDSLINDYFTRLLRVPEQVKEQYESELSPELRAVLEAYAAGLNYYAARHPGEVSSRLLPVTGKDIAAGFAHKVPLFMGFHKVLKYLGEAEKPPVVGDDLLATDLPERYANISMIASNSHAVGYKRSEEGVTRLNVNSHQPWEGPVAWWEAQLVSEEGWNMTGGTFPGAPLILMGHNEHLGWTHTVNKSDYVDVYKLEMKGPDSLEYRLDGEWRKLEVSNADLKIDILLFDLTFNREVLWSEHGPVFKTDHGYYALRYAGIGKLLRTVEQWFQMNKARNFKQWKSAMARQDLPMFNTVYADYKNIYYVYNALIPDRKREKELNWKGVLPGNRSDLIWKKYMPYAKLPAVENPRSGFVQNCNSTPFITTVGKGNPDKRDYVPENGIDSRITNRAIRSRKLFGEDKKISREEFLRYKFDRIYDPEAPIFKEAINTVLEKFKPLDDPEKKALELLKNWDRSTEPDSVGAVIAIMTWREIWKAIVIDHSAKLPDPLDTFRKTVRFLMKHYGRVDVKLGDVQFMKRGDLARPLGGGPDVLNAIHSVKDSGNLIGTAGDSYILIVEFSKKDPVRSWALHQFGNSNRPDSPHFADQAPLFLKREMRVSLRTRAEIRKNLEREYHPGEEIKN